jgi:hypothetical protein
MNNNKKLIKRFYRSIFRCVEHIQNKEFEAAFTIAENKKVYCKNIILLGENSNSSQKNVALAFGICFKSLEEFSELFSIISHDAWLFHLKAVQRVWFLLQNCNDRFELILSSLNFPEEISEYFLNSLKGMVIEIERKYGKGMYVSPEVKIKKCVCNICNQDPRSCSHIENYVYDGKICRVIPTVIQPGNCLVITPNPKDKRCRIWEIENSTDTGAIAKNVPFLVSFREDDFIFDESNGCLSGTFNFNDNFSGFLTETETNSFQPPSSVKIQEHKIADHPIGSGRRQ